MRHSLLSLGLAALALLLAAVPTLQAQDSVIYRCTDASGALTMQNKPCGPGMKQETRNVGILPTAPPPTAREKPAPAAAPPILGNFELVVGPQTTPLPPATTPEAEREPPPALFQCKTWDEDVFVTENGEPEARCAPLATTGLDGNPDMAAGEACEMRTDECTPIIDDALCQAWRGRVDEAEFRWKYARAGDSNPRKAEYDRLAKILAESSCNK